MWRLYCYNNIFKLYIISYKWVNRKITNNKQQQKTGMKQKQHLQSFIHF